MSASQWFPCAGEVCKAAVAATGIRCVLEIVVQPLSVKEVESALHDVQLVLLLPLVLLVTTAVSKSSQGVCLK